MKLLSKILFTITILILFNANCKALSYGGCDYSTISSLKKLVNNVNISYTYEIRDNQAFFNVTLNNIPNNVYLVDSLNQKQYSYTDTENGELVIKDYSGISDGKYTFYVNNDICNGIKLGERYYKFPIYNSRRNSELCLDIPNYSLCKKWISKYYSQSEFEKNIENYKKNLESNEEKVEQIKFEKDFMSKIVEFYIKYYYYFLPAIIIPCIAIIIVSNRKDRFKL